MGRKDRIEARNIGNAVSKSVTPYFGGPPAAEARTNIVLVERLILQILRTEIDRLLASEEELQRFFSHFFDPLAGEAERKSFAVNFQRKPPTVVLGYPRVSAEFPCIAVVLENESEETNVLGDYLGQTIDGEKNREATEYVGAVFEQTYGVYIYAENPDITIYLYQFVKLVLFGGKGALIEAGLIDPRFSGGELSPEDQWLPNNMFVRKLNITAGAVISVPVLLTLDPSRVKLAGIYREDIVVDGVRGGVVAYVPDPEEE
jgi:hypothetical protein